MRPRMASCSVLIPALPVLLIHRESCQAALARAVQAEHALQVWLIAKLCLQEIVHQRFPSLPETLVPPHTGTFPSPRHLLGMCDHLCPHQMRAGCCGTFLPVHWAGTSPVHLCEAEIQERQGGVCCSRSCCSGVNRVPHGVLRFLCLHCTTMKQYMRRVLALQALYSSADQKQSLADTLKEKDVFRGRRQTHTKQIISRALGETSSRGCRS